MRTATLLPFICFVLSALRVKAAPTPPYSVRRSFLSHGKRCWYQCPLTTLSGGGLIGTGESAPDGECNYVYTGGQFSICKYDRVTGMTHPGNEDDCPKMTGRNLICLVDEPRDTSRRRSVGGPRRQRTPHELKIISLQHKFVRRGSKDQLEEVVKRVSRPSNIGRFKWRKHH